VSGIPMSPTRNTSIDMGVEDIYHSIQSRYRSTVSYITPELPKSPLKPDCYAYFLLVMNWVMRLAIVPPPVFYSSLLFPSSTDPPDLENLAGVVPLAKGSFSPGPCLSARALSTGSKDVNVGTRFDACSLNHTLFPIMAALSLPKAVFGLSG
jgi:hypothetical protein